MLSSFASIGHGERDREQRPRRHWKKMNGSLHPGLSQPALWFFCFTSVKLMVKSKRKKKKKKKVWADRIETGQVSVCKSY